MTKLSVNVNKIATLRNSRGKNLPSVEGFAERILRWGAHGITIHPRPDGRHIQRHDVDTLHQLLFRMRHELDRPDLEFNIEGYPSDDFLKLMDRVRPDQCTLVPDPPEALTSNAGWSFSEQKNLLLNVCHRLRASGIRTSLFLEPLAMMEWDWDALNEIHPDRVELYTEAYSDSFGTSGQAEILKVYQDASERALAMDIGLNAGHDLNQQNLGALVEALPDLKEVSIGHALVCESLLEGMESSVKNYLRILNWQS